MFSLDLGHFSQDADSSCVPVSSLGSLLGAPLPVAAHPVLGGVPEQYERPRLAPLSDAGFAMLLRFEVAIVEVDRVVADRQGRVKPVGGQAVEPAVELPNANQSGGQSEFGSS